MTIPDAGGAALIGIDVGTSSLRALAFDAAGRKLAGASRPTPTVPAPTGGEHDPEAIFMAVLAVLADVGRELAGRPVAGMAVASFGESCVLVDAAGRALAPAIVWHDRRTEAAALAIGERLDPARGFALTGHAVDPTFTLFKLAWMREYWPEAMRNARRVLMMADWIALRLCGEAATDQTLASRTFYFDIHRRRWSEELLTLAGIDPALPAPLRPSGTALARVRAEVLAATGLAGQPAVGVGGHDHIIGFFGAGLSAPGAMVDSLGTAEAVLLATAAPLTDPAVIARGYFQGAIATDRAMSYLGGGIYMSGGAIEWLRGITGGATHAGLIAEAAAVPPGANGVMFLPHLGNGPPPTPDRDARGAFVGLTAAATRGTLYRALLEGLALQARLMVDGMEALAGAGAVAVIRAIGGGSRNPLFVQIKANCFGRPLTVIDEADASALGAALLGGVAAGLFSSLADGLAGLVRPEHTVEPDGDAGRYAVLREVVFAHLQPALQPVNRHLAELARRAT